MTSPLLTTFGLLPPLLTAGGLYRVTAFDVIRRTCEVCRRVTLGAPRRDILSLVFGSAACVETTAALRNE